MATLEADLKKLSLQDRAQKHTNQQEEEYHEDEDEPGYQQAISPFRFFDLPSEIRLKIYGYVLFGSKRKVSSRTNGNVGLSSKNKPLAPLSHRLSLFLASQRIHDEAAALFYSVQTFRVFPIQDYSRFPTLADLGKSYRPMIGKIELILGSSWTAPPKSWKITHRLGLAEMVNLRIFRVFIQCDPSHPIFEGFRISNDFYTGFAGGLVRQILELLPNLEHVEFDAWPSVQKNGALMRRLLAEVRGAGKQIYWGPERGWNDWEDDDNGNTVTYGSTDPITIKDRVDPGPDVSPIVG
ncbi:hypothetical protein BGW36DRAFT_383832 [Talaromyces proteolyticus]|uniref:F-box domain-containing protein n=1 Tax=Talaromyces proteolyticus TaxID=1131652 RepID=A0AAD4KLG1_9EURO|nr:uncharacterized protein BGW36DRAFT_383832 [Talaromyces proteolyticus]KAH8693831.1 hypothetical protein BGW36DRAFT_383832 [Talaromyces proteolyticus]